MYRVLWSYFEKVSLSIKLHADFLPLAFASRDETLFTFSLYPLCSFRFFWLLVCVTLRKNVFKHGNGKSCKAEKTNNALFCVEVLVNVGSC